MNANWQIAPRSLCIAMMCTVLQSAVAENVAWIRQFGTPPRNLGLGVAADGMGSIYVSGITAGDLAGPGANSLFGYDDAFVAKISDVPEPGSLAIAVIGAAMLWTTCRCCNRNPRSGGVT